MDLTVPATFAAQGQNQYKIGLSMERMAINQDQTVADLIQSSAQQAPQQLAAPPAHRGQQLDILA